MRNRIFYLFFDLQKNLGLTHNKNKTKDYCAFYFNSLQIV